MTDALLVLEDGTTFRGRSRGAAGETFGEIVFNTGMSGYQEVLTDPSYAGQIVVMTYPHQGNYGVNEDDPESSRISVAGFVVREAARRPSSWRADRGLQEYLADAGVVAVDGVDTRALTVRIRDAGAMRAAISTEDLDPRSLVARVRRHPEMLGADLARTVSAPEPYRGREVVGPPTPRRGRTFRVAALDWGLKRNSLRLLARSGCDTVVYPALTPARGLLDDGFDGVFLSNGPGDPAATGYAVEAVRALLGRVPVFGICLGHQVLALALGGRTYKLKFGHRGANQPVIDAESGRVEVTSHNHGFAVDPTAWIPAGPSPGSDRFAEPTWSAAVAAAGSSPLPQREGSPASETSGFHTLLRGSPPPPRAAVPPGAALDTAAHHGARWVAEAATTSVPIVDTPFGSVALTHWNLNDGTLEGLRCLDVPAFSVQYHPEAAPGPHDSAWLFDRFAALMEAGG